MLFLTVIPSQAQWIQVYLAYPSGGIAWLKFDFGSFNIGYLAVNRWISPSQGYAYTLFKTTNGGASWQSASQDMPDFSSQDSIADYVGATVDKICCPHPDSLLMAIRDYIPYTHGRIYYKWGVNSGSYSFENYLICDMSAVSGRLNYVLTYQLYNHLALYRCVGNNAIKIYQNDTLSAIESSLLFYADSLIGYMAVQAPSQLNVLLKTTDGGISWSALSAPLLSLKINSMFFTSPDVGYLAYNGGNLYKTTDQGNNWSLLNTGTTTWLNSVWFASDTVGAACGGDGTVILTHDGGETWESENCEDNLTTIRLFSGNQAYVCNSKSAPQLFRGINQPLSVESQPSPDIFVYPNPVTGNLYFGQNSLIPDEFNYELTDNKGLVVKNGRAASGNPISCNNLPPGLYFLKLILPNKTIVSKVILSAE